MPTHTPLIRYLSALYATAPAESFVELRVRATNGMSRAFFVATELSAVAAAVDRFAPHADTFVGVLPRRRRGGGRADLVPDGAVVWVDCDTDDSVAKLERFTPQPSIVIASGTAGHRHAYWLLREPWPISDIERANRLLVNALGGDRACVDAPRILRPPSLNHTQNTPAAVRVLRCRPSERYPLDCLEDVAGMVPWVPGTRCADLRPVQRRRDSVGDPLLRLEPAAYLRRLAGVTVPLNRKVRCPFHDDQTPSLHVYIEPTRGWYCFGCGRGGSIYDFAAHLWEITPRGEGFAELRSRLSGRFA